MDMEQPKQMTVRRESREAGHRFYDWKPCAKCGTTVRYVSTGKCRACTIEQSLSHYYGRKPEPE